MSGAASAGRNDRRWPWPAGAPLVFLAALALYLSTLAPTVYNLDSAELTTAAYSGGVLRAPGYPLYLLIGRAWSRLPIGDVGYRMNLFSAVCGALTLALAYRLLRQLEIGPWPAVGGIGLLAASHWFWAMSSVAEVYTLHTLLFVVLLLALVAYGERPGPKRLGLATLIFGLGLSHHVATILLAPGALLFVLWTAGRRALQPRSLAWAAGGLLAGLSLYLYLPILQATEPAFNYAGHFDASGAFVPVDLGSPRGLWWLVSGRAFADRMLAVEGAPLLHDVASFAAELWRLSLGIGVGVALFGWGSAVRRRPPLAVALAVMFFVHAAFYVSYDVIDKATMFLPNHLVWALFLAFGYQALERLIAGHRSPGGSSVWVYALRATAVVALALGIAWNWRGVDLSDDFSSRRRGESILRSVEPDALVIGWWTTVPVVQYLQLVEHQRPDVTALNRFLIEASDLRRLVESESARRPVYSDTPIPEISPRFQTLVGDSLLRIGPITQNGQAPDV